MKTPLISLSPPHRGLERELLDAEGGFLWWYVDLIDDNGDGLVLIWSYGLPFLPGYARAQKRGQPQRPRQRPCINLSIYRGGRLDFYLLQEFRPEQVDWSAGERRWRFGHTHLHSEVDERRLRLVAEIDCAVGGCDERLSGRVELDGVCRRSCGAETPPGALPDHDWTPRTGPARATADLSLAGHRWQLSGRAYHDRNGGAAALHELGIDHWLWGRAPLEERELIYYLLWHQEAPEPVCLVLSVAADGSTRVFDDLTVRLGQKRRNLAGLSWWRRLELSRGGTPWLSVLHTHTVDSGPFYMRYLTEATARGPHGATTTSGIGEWCEPGRIDLNRHRPLVRMRVHDLGGTNSMWLPLFTGPRQGRVRRLVKSWLSGGRR